MQEVRERIGEEEMSLGISSGDTRADMQELVNKYSEENAQRRAEGKPLPVEELLKQIQRNLVLPYSDDQSVFAQEMWLKDWINESDIEQEVPKILIEKISQLKLEVLKEKKDKQQEEAKASLFGVGIILAVSILMCFFVQSNGAAPLNFEEFSLSAILESDLVILGLMFPSAFIVVGVQFITEFICEKKKWVRTGIFITAFLVSSILLAFNIF